MDCFPTKKCTNKCKENLLSNTCHSHSMYTIPEVISTNLYFYITMMYSWTVAIPKSTNKCYENQLLNTSHVSVINYK